MDSRDTILAGADVLGDWAGHKKVLQYLIEQAPENNRADPTILDDDGATRPLLLSSMMHAFAPC